MAIIVFMYQLFRFFRSHRALYYALLIATSVILIILGSHLTFEEDISKLLPPPAEENKSLDLAFSDLKVKDNLFLQIHATSQAVTPDSLIEICDNLMENILTADSANHDINSTLYDIDPMMLLDLADYLLANIPSYIDTSCYSAFDSLFSAEHLSAQMQSDQELLLRADNDLLSMLVMSDPAGLRNAILGFDAGSMGASTKKMNYKIIDGHLFNRDSTTCIAFISPAISSKDSKSAIRLLRTIQGSISKITNPDVEVLYHGAVVQSANNSLRTKRDIKLTMGVSFAIILILLLIALRQPNNILLLLLPIVYGTFFAMSFIWLWQGTMSLMAMGVAAVVLGVAMSYCLHIIIHYKYTGDRELTIQQQTKPVILGSLTTIGSFAGLLFTSSSLLSDFGLFALFALVGTTMAALIFMPQHFPRNNKKNERIFSWMEKVSAYPLDEKRWFVALISVAVIVLICFASKVEFDPDLHHINYTSPEALRAMQMWNGNTADGSKQQYYATMGNDINEALEAQKDFEAACARLKHDSIINSYTPMAKFLPSLQTQQVRIDAWHDYFSLHADEIESRIRREAEQLDVDPEIYETFYAMMRQQYEPSLLLEEGVIPDNIIGNFTEKIGDKYLVFTPVTMPIANLDSVNDVLTKVENALVLDPFYYATDLVKLINDDFYIILLISSIFVFLVLIVAYHNWLLALIAFLPMGLSWYVVEGAMALTGQEFNLINIVVSSFIFGIGVDYSIFVMDGLIASARGEDTKLLAYHKTAITISAIILIICMGSLLFAVHPSIHSIAFPSLIGMITTLLLSYTIQPFLFKALLKTNMGKGIVMNSENKKKSCCK